MFHPRVARLRGGVARHRTRLRDVRRSARSPRPLRRGTPSATRQAHAPLASRERRFDPRLRVRAGAEHGSRATTATRTTRFTGSDGEWIVWSSSGCARKSAPARSCVSLCSTWPSASFQALARASGVLAASGTSLPVLACPDDRGRERRPRQIEVHADNPRRRLLPCIGVELGHEALEHEVALFRRGSRGYDTRERVSRLQAPSTSPARSLGLARRRIRYRNPIRT